MRLALGVTLCVLGLLLGTSTQGWAFDTVVADASCRVEGFPRPLRQTIIIVDEAGIEPFVTGKASESNRRINRAILGIAGVLDGQAEGISAPRERLTILFAREDGSDLIRAFTGCPPVYSKDELHKLEATDSGIFGQFWKFLGRDARANVEKAKQAFQSSILQTMIELAKIRGTKRNVETPISDDIGFLQALPLSRGTFDLAEGIPRLVIISPMDLRFSRNFSDVKSARQKGFEIATRLGADFRRAEVYLIGVSREASRYTRDFAYALVLGMKGRLSAVSGEALPGFAEPPSLVRVYGGAIDYPNQKIPMQLRLSVDRSGSLINSWMEVSVLRAVATPLTGKATCKGRDNDQCDVLGDGNEFGQSWVADVQSNPTFNEKLPFNGVRYFQFSISGSTLKGRVYDPNVVIGGKKDGLSFELAATPDVRF